MTILSYKTNFRKFVRVDFSQSPKNCDFGHFLARLAKIGQNENFYQKSGRAIFYPYCPPTSCQVSEKSLERFPRSIRCIHPYIHTYIHTYKGDPIEPVAFAGSITHNIKLIIQ